MIQERNWVYVEGLNCKVEEYMKGSDGPGTYIQREQPLLVTNEVALVDPNDLWALDYTRNYSNLFIVHPLNVNLTLNKHNANWNVAENK